MVLVILCCNLPHKTSETRVLLALDHRNCVSNLVLPITMYLHFLQITTRLRIHAKTLNNHVTMLSYCSNLMTDIIVSPFSTHKSLLGRGTHHPTPTFSVYNVMHCML